MQNVAHLIGRLGRDPEIKRNDSGFAMTTISIATERRWRDRESGEAKSETTWIPVKLLGKTAENAGKYLRKGSLIGVTGWIQVQKYEKDGQNKVFTCVMANRIHFLSNYGDGSGGASNSSSSSSSSDEASAPAGGQQQDFDDDIPF